MSEQDMQKNTVAEQTNAFKLTKQDNGVAILTMDVPGESMNTLNIGWDCVELGCGRRNKDDILDKTAGIEFLSKTGDKVNPGDPLFRCFNSDNNKLNSATNYLKDSVAIGPEIVNPTLFYNA